ncbi:TPA: ketopantoate reductase family protein [Candidatus Bathyarchaeota archaeon]|nr:ketopantoate reductase family protein [Candidatus Bathyarchaeota archaeon]
MILGMRFIVYGAGGIGSIIGGHLFRIGGEVVLVGSERHVDAVKKFGLRLLTPDITYTLKIPACKTADELAPFRGDDVVILTAKSQHTAVCLGQLKNAGAPRNLPLFCAQNSIVNEPAATRAFDNVYGAVLNMPAIFLTPGEVIHPITGNGGLIEVGRYPASADELSQRVASALLEAGFACKVNTHVMRAKAAKTLLNLNNALEAITDAKGDAAAYNLATRTEAENVWKRAGIEWEDFHEFEKRSKAIRGKNKMPAGYEGETKRSSTWQSMTRGTGNVEAEAINGDIVKLGRALGIPTPYNETLCRIAEDMARKGEKPGRYTIEQLTEMARRNQ